MPCTTCKRVVQINNTGICLSCQRGFTHHDQEDIYNIVEPKPFGVLDLTFKTMEEENALEERIQQENDFSKHSNRDEIGKASKASHRNSLKCRKKS